ncbi:MAG TPA: hypothetical protein VFM49_30385 [Chloroflexia bacterium]|jgi:hypothetical protein|nr:hypothetical protein [Chloroflexia bacterium]
MVPALLESPFVQLLLLGVASAAVRHFLLRRGESATASGAIAMAIGIFVLGALQHMPFPVAALTQILTLTGLIVWAYIAASYVRSYFRGTFHNHTDDPVGGFAVGTWVAGTAVLARLVVIVLPAWRPLGLALAALTLVVWLWYLTLIDRRYRIILSSPTPLHITGRILLATVSTQSLVLLIEQLFPGQVPDPLAASLISLGYGFYGLGFVLIVQRYLRRPGWRLADDWDNTNCILHGAMSITVLAALESRALPDPVIIASWLWAAALFVIVEVIEIARLVARVRAYGWRRGLAVYQVSQWARNFTFGMFYAATARLQVLGAAAGLGLAGLPALQAAIVAWGQYVVLILLIIEISLFMSQNAGPRLQKLFAPAPSMTGVVESPQR